MSDDLHEVEAYIGGLMAKFSNSERARLARKIALDIRRSQSDRIAAQRNPDGSAFAARKAQAQPLRAKTGRIKRKAKGKAMFAKLRRAQYLSAESSPSQAVVGFRNPVTARVASVHQRGLTDRVSKRPGAPSVKYPVRRLLGLSEADRNRIMDLMIALVAS